MRPTLEIINSDCRRGLRRLERRSIQCVITSPPYWGMRDYEHDGQLGHEESPAAYAKELLMVFREVRRVLSVEGTVWLNLGDRYAGNLGWGPQDQYGSDGPRSNLLMRHAHKPNKGFGIPKGLKGKDLVGIPWQVAFRLRDDGWYLRCDIIWCKPSTMPGKYDDRPTRNHEYIFLLSKSDRYFYNANAIKVESTTGGTYRGLNSAKEWEMEANDLINNVKVGRFRNRRSVWRIPMQPYADAHFACFPEGLPKLCILAGSRVGDTVLDMFAGSGTTGKVALDLGRSVVLMESNPDYLRLIRRRCSTWNMTRIGENKWESKQEFELSSDKRLKIILKEWEKENVR